MADLASLPLDRLERMAADPANAAVRPALARRIAELRAGAGDGNVAPPLNPPPASGTKILVEKADTAPARKRRQGHTVGVMNQTEADFARQVLDPRAAAIVSLGYLFERLVFTLPGIGTYRPDFVERLPDGLFHAWEVKGGFIHRDGRVKYKAAVHEYPWIRWTMVQRKSRTAPWVVLYDRGARHGGELPSALTPTEG